MKILITGGLGFVGSHCVEGVIKHTDWDIVILDALTYAGNINRLADIDIWQGNHYEKLFNSDQAFRIKIVWHDLRAEISETTHKLIGDIDYVWHLAAESHVENSLKDPIPFAYNVISTTNLLWYLKNKQPSLKKYIGFNTDEVFGPAPDGVFYKETDKFYPSNPYSASKGGQWCMEYSFYRSHRMPIVQVHSMNIFGERQHPEKFIPMVVKRLLSGEKITIHGIKGESISSRCWIHAREVCNGLIFLMGKGKIGETYNIIGEERSVLELANTASMAIKARDLHDDEIDWVDYHKNRPGHDLRYALSGEKIKELGWSPSNTLDQSFSKMVKWMADNPKWLNL